MRRLLPALLVTLLNLQPGLAAAHEGHGLPNPHWHASDLFGIALVVGVLAAAFWSRKK
jgi:hypothetical protein